MCSGDARQGPVRRGEDYFYAANQVEASPGGASPVEAGLGLARIAFTQSTKAGHDRAWRDRVLHGAAGRGMIGLGGSGLGGARITFTQPTKAWLGAAWLVGSRLDWSRRGDAGRGIFSNDKE